MYIFLGIIGLFVALVIIGWRTGFFDLFFMGCPCEDRVLKTTEEEEL